MKSLLLFSYILLAVLACSLPRQKNNPEVVQKDLPGYWQSARATLKISCSGDFDLSDPDHFSLMGLKELKSEIISIQENKLIVWGMFSNWKFDFEPPHKTPEGTQMSLQQQVWKKINEMTCQL